MKYACGDLMGNNDELIETLKRLLRYINAYKVLSEEELRLKIAEEVSRIEEGSRKEMEDKFGGRLEDLIFESITTHEKLSIFSPDLHVKINYLGEIFYCPPSHTYMEAEIADAYLRLVEMRIDFDRFRSVIIDFLQKAGYRTEVLDEKDRILAEKEGFKTLNLHLLPTINIAGERLEELEGEGNVIVVPTEKTPWAFVNFIRRMDEYPINDTMIWVANIEKGTVDPLIGDTTDDKINSGFDNPRRARKAVQIWRASLHGGMPFGGMS
ncbi:MAG: hypothetical protein CW694_02085 [Candidatus Syntrophoarchaeum sp. WYZ-LMO15]|nr:MAG: hypothetical protein CW694_02085 [Candidatus Syntrophoarchaeum sp. WYZ-LMO15]